ncbi:MAG: phosphatase PAP2 family protein, partial [Deltaproteobacteria bacterium]|nr:phosphatase PAP2 family protein [Deltaproteobacteria bacterium]
NLLRPLVLCCLLLSFPARAEKAATGAPAPAPSAPLMPRLSWSPSWARASWHDTWFMAPAAAVAGVSLFTARQGNFPSGPALFDEALRPAVRPSTLEQRLRLRALSDVTLGATMAWPVVVDALLLAGWAHGSPDVALQLALSDVEAVAFAVSVQFATAAWVGRERPYGSLCREGGELDPASHDCSSTFARYRSFFSGHATAAFASAGLVCAHNAHLPLYGSRAGGAAACAGAVTLALATATLRVSGDQHWPTDVLTGAAWGFSVGMALPLLTRYLVPFKPPVDVYADGAGAGIRGKF